MPQLQYDPKRGVWSTNAGTGITKLEPSSEVQGHPGYYTYAVGTTTSGEKVLINPYTGETTSQQQAQAQSPQSHPQPIPSSGVYYDSSSGILYVNGKGVGSTSPENAQKFASQVTGKPVYDPSTGVLFSGGYGYSISPEYLQSQGSTPSVNLEFTFAKPDVIQPRDVSNPRMIKSPFAMTEQFNRVPNNIVGPDIRPLNVSEEYRYQYAERPQTQFAYSVFGQPGGVISWAFSYGTAVLMGKSYAQWDTEMQSARIEWLKQIESQHRKGTEVQYSFLLGTNAASPIYMEYAGMGLLGGTGKTALNYGYKSILGLQTYETLKSYKEGGQGTAENVAALTLLAIPSALGKVPLKYREVRIPAETELGPSEKVIWRGASIEMGKWSQPLVGFTSTETTFGIPRLPAGNIEPFLPKISPTSATATRILFSQFSPEEYALSFKAVDLVGKLENTMSKVKGTLPPETKSLPIEALKAQYEFIIKESGVGYGSNIAYASRAEDLNKIVGLPGDTDAQFLAAQEAIGNKITKNLLPEQKPFAQVRQSKERLTLMESKPPMEDWRHSFDAHTYEDMGAAPSKMFGFKLGKPEIKRFTEEGQPMLTMPLREQLIRDLNIFNPHVTETPEGKIWTFGPEEKRMKDILKFYPDAEQLIRSGTRTPWGRNSLRKQLNEINAGLKAKFPDAFAENAAEILGESPYARKASASSRSFLAGISFGSLGTGYSPSISKSLSRSFSPASISSFSSSLSKSISRSLSQSMSPSPSPSFSFSPSSSISKSLSPSPSLSISFSPSPSFSFSPSPSPSGSLSGSFSPSPSLSKSLSNIYKSLSLPIASFNPNSLFKKAKASKVSRKKQRYEYAPSLWGMSLEFRIPKAPKNFLSGIGIRPMVGNVRIRRKRKGSTIPISF